MKQLQQEKLAQQIKSVLDQSVEDIDVDTRYQLQIARAKLLQSSDVANRWYQRKSIWLGMTSFACMFTLAAILYIGSLEYQLNDVDMMSNVDGLIFESDTGIEMYEQYDFYVWLSKQEANS